MGEEEQQQRPPEFVTPPTRGPGVQDLTRSAVSAIPETFGLPGQFLSLQEGLEPQLARLQSLQSRNLGGLQLQAQREFGPEAIKLLQEQTRMAAPEEMALQDSILRRASEEFNLGGALSPEEERQIRQDIAANQVSRGINTAGLGEVIQEVGNIRGARQRTAEGRRLAAFQALGLPGQFGLAQNLPMAPIARRADPGFSSFIPSIGQTMGAESARYGSPVAFGGGPKQESRNPFLVGLGLAGQTAATIYGGNAGGQMAGYVNNKAGIGPDYAAEEQANMSYFQQ